jgi:hypothetical protein
MPSAYADAMRVLARVLAAGAVVELAGRALVDVEVPGPVVPGDRTGTWLAFDAAEPGIHACCPIWQAVPTAVLSPACRSWLRLGDSEELPELLPVAEWLAALGPGGIATFTVGLLHGLGRMADAPARGMLEDGTRLVIRTPESLTRELFG